MDKKHDIPIVGVGASAGGIEALEGFFSGLPANPGLAIVVVTHLAPKRESMLPQIVRRYTQIPVFVATDGTQVEVDRVYVMQENAILTLQDGQLRLRKSETRERFPIDLFFSSLAVDQGEFAAGVILSGADGDGTLGVKALKEHGGFTLAQVTDGFGPQLPDMPQSAIAAGLIDLAIPVGDMGAKLVDFARDVRVLDEVVASTIDPASNRSGDSAIDEIYAVIRSQIGHDFSGYKPKTFLRRVTRRMQMTQVGSITDYVELLRRDAQEVSALFRDLLINVTGFFRDTDSFACLAERVVPKLFEGRGAEDIVRVWVPGCSTGEEVYSIAMLLREHMATLPVLPRVQVFATDIDVHSLAVARMARYPLALLSDVSEERRRRFFIAEGDSYVVAKEVREICVFSPHSVIRDPPFSRMDLISCRNLLIYFGTEVQNQVIPTFHYALRPDGFLFLGTAENVSQFDELFTAIDKKHRIFQKRADVSINLRVPIAIRALRDARVGELIGRQEVRSGLALRQAVDERVLERFAPPHVVVNRDGDVLYFSSRTGKYLEPPAGAPTRQLVTLARKGLRLDLRTVLREAIETGRAASRGKVSIEDEQGEVQQVSLWIEPLQKGDTGQPVYLVLFLDRGAATGQEETSSQAATAGHTVHLERELSETRDRLQSLIEEYETALEELKASNEELVSVNEELQSTNEELEASKEELQSLNEELHTVNSELTGKVDALDSANSDLAHLFQSTDVATVFLDKNLVIRSYTPAVRHIFKILPGDVGRPLTDLSCDLELDRLNEDLHRVFTGEGTIERQVGSLDHEDQFLVRLAPYRERDQIIDGVVVSFIDVTMITRAEARQRVLIAELQHRTRNLLAVVQSIAQRTLSDGPALDEFTSRLKALARVQALVGNSKGDRVELLEMLRLELDAVGADQERVKLAGPSVLLGFDMVQTLGLALHELTTNAVKHGALRDTGEVPAGRLSVSWEVMEQRDQDRTLKIHWRESGVTDMPPVIGKGFGRELLERALVFTLRAKTAMNFLPDGVDCVIELPLRRGDDIPAPAEPS